eukprot:TRINITY_DN2651_c0_g1_i1.p1 TRINITY_DN2651_c0_g1~~TRINITY_DN2651_c0_g1_i1.p1  ORF type:complete len:664 (+),score=140.59 TRINITY_DN2651_c0_g1_i1:163-2154(+)
MDNYYPLDSQDHTTHTRSERIMSAPPLNSSKSDITADIRLNKPADAHADRRGLFKASSSSSRAVISGGDILVRHTELKEEEPTTTSSLASPFPSADPLEEGQIVLSPPEASRDEEHIRRRPGDINEDEEDEDEDWEVNLDRPAPVRVLSADIISGSRYSLTPHASASVRRIPDAAPAPAPLPVASNRDRDISSAVTLPVQATGGERSTPKRKAPSFAEQKVMMEEQPQVKSQTGPPDGGYGWVIVGCAFSILFVVLGTQYSFGVIYVALLNDFNSTKATTALVGSVNLASFLFFGAPTGRLIQVLGPRRVTQIGSVIVGIFLLVSGETNSLWQLFLVFGVCTGCGFSLSYGPALIILSTYFDKKRPLAVGIAVSGSGVGTLVMAQIVSALVSNLGWRNCFRVLSAIAFVVIFTAGSLYKELPQTAGTAYTSSRADAAHSRRSVVQECCQMDKIIDVKFLRANKFIQCMCATMMISAFGYFVPSIYLVAYATQTGISSTNASYLVSIQGIGSTFGRILFGKISAGAPRKRVLIFTGCTIATGCFACLLPLLAKIGYGGFVIFCVCYGMVAGAFIAVMPVVTADLVGLAKLPRSLGLESTSQVGTVLCGPVLAGLVADNTGTYSYSFLLAGGFLLASSLPLLLIPRLVASQPKKQDQPKTLKGGS